MKYKKETTESKRFEYDIDNKEHRKIIRDFEKELEALKAEPLEKPLAFYGEPKEKLPAFELGGRKFPESIQSRRVSTDVTGLIDVGIVQHLLRIKAISRRHVNESTPGWGWAVGPDLKAYEDFYQKKGALDELKYRRQYAKEKEQESFDALIEGREALSKSMGFNR